MVCGVCSRVSTLLGKASKIWEVGRKSVGSWQEVGRNSCLNRYRTRSISQPVRWKWKKKEVGLSSVMSELKLSTLQGFCAVDHDFLRLPQLLKTFCNHDYHMRQIKLALD